MIAGRKYHKTGVYCDNLVQHVHSVDLSATIDKINYKMSKITKPVIQKGIILIPLRSDGSILNLSSPS